MLHSEAENKINVIKTETKLKRKYKLKMKVKSKQKNCSIITRTTQSAVVMILTENVGREKASDTAGHQKSPDDKRRITVTEYRHHNSDDFRRRENDDGFLATEPIYNFNNN